MSIWLIPEFNLLKDSLYFAAKCLQRVYKIDLITQEAQFILFEKSYISICSLSTNYAPAPVCKLERLTCISSSEKGYFQFENIKWGQSYRVPYGVFFENVGSDWQQE